MFLRSVLLLALYIFSAGANSLEERNNNNNWEYVLYTPNALRHGIQGPGVSPTKVTIGSVVGQNIYQYDANRRTISELVAQPQGEADDEAFGPDGTLVWTSILSGLVRSRTTDGTIRIVGNNTFPNGVAFDTKGNCYYSQFPVGDGIWKINPKGSAAEQRRVYTTRLPLNGFDFSSNDEIFGPYPFSGEVVKINLATQTETVIASGFIDPEAVRFNSDKTILYVLDTGATAIYSVNIRTGAKTVVAKINGLVYLDNFRPLGDGLLIADTTSNAPIFYDLQKRSYEYVTPVSVFNLPMGLSYSNGKLFIADFTAEKVYNVRSRNLRTIARSGPQPESAGRSAVNVSYGIYNAFASNSYLALSCFYDGKVQIRDTNTNQVIVNTIPAGVPYGLAFGKSNSILFIADFFTGLRVNTGPQFQTSRIIAPNGDTLIVGVAVSLLRKNTVYASSYSGNLYVIDYVTGVARILASGFNQPEGITVVSPRRGQESVVVANVGAKNLVMVAENGSKTIVATNLPIGLAGPSTLPPPNTFTGVAADDEDVYITSDLSDALIKVRCVRS